MLVNLPLDLWCYRGGARSGARRVWARRRVGRSDTLTSRAHRLPGLGIGDSRTRRFPVAFAQNGAENAPAIAQRHQVTLSMLTRSFDAGNLDDA